MISLFDTDWVVDYLKGKAAALRALLAHYAQVPAQAQPYIDELGNAREAFFWLLTLDFGVTMAQAYLTWLDKVIEQLRDSNIPPRTHGLLTKAKS